MSERGEYNCYDKWCAQADHVSSVRAVKQVSLTQRALRWCDLLTSTDVLWWNINNSKYSCRFSYFPPRTTTQPELSCMSVLGSLGRRWRSRTTFPTWWAATASIGSPPSECWEERKYSGRKSLFRLSKDGFLRHTGKCAELCSGKQQPGRSDRFWHRITGMCFQLGGVPGAQLQGTSLHPGEAGLQQFLRLGKSEQHGGLHAKNPLQLKPPRSELSATQAVILVIN